MAGRKRKTRESVWLDHEGNNWHVVAVEARKSFDELSDTVTKVRGIGVVERDVGTEVLAGDRPPPDGRWGLLVKFKNNPCGLSSLGPITTKPSVGHGVSSDVR